MTVHALVVVKQPAHPKLPHKASSFFLALAGVGKTIADLRRLVSYVLGLYKSSDEILVNTIDNKQRDSSMAVLKVTIDAKQNTISVFNNGDAIPVEIPKLICGHLLTDSNYDDKVKKTTGGRNGYSAKLTNIFSTKFIIKIADGKRKNHPLLLLSAWELTPLDMTFHLRVTASKKFGFVGKSCTKDSTA